MINNERAELFVNGSLSCYHMLVLVDDFFYIA